jgi:hypothetical protein
MLPIIIESDASIKAAGAVLLQSYLHGDQSVLHPVAYFSKKWDLTQGKYGTQERELLALMLALRHWRHWIEDGDLTCITDHKSLKLINNKVEQSTRIARFIDQLEHYGARITYRAGKANVLVDYLSRSPEPAYAAREGKLKQMKPITRPEVLNRIDLQAVYEHLARDEPLPPNLDPTWVRKHFVKHEDRLCKV